VTISENTLEKSKASPLVRKAIVAYARCFTTSNVRKRLNTIVDVPDEHKGVHESMVKLCNSTVAH